MKIFNVQKIKEVCMNFNRGKYKNIDPSEKGKPAFERCVELLWLEDKVKQLNPISGSMIDFGCNKAQYIRDFKKKYNFTTYGIDAKKPGGKFVDHFYGGLFNKKTAKKIRSLPLFDLGTSISSIEHSGCAMPKERYVRNYQTMICQFMIDVSKNFFLSVPFGMRPGWADDRSRLNFYQFDSALLDSLQSYAESVGKSYMEEFYILDNGHWVSSTRHQNMKCKYRDKKQGATSVALVSIWKD